MNSTVDTKLDKKYYTHEISILHPNTPTLVQDGQLDDELLREFTHFRNLSSIDEIAQYMVDS